MPIKSPRQSRDLPTKISTFFNVVRRIELLISDPDSFGASQWPLKSVIAQGQENLETELKGVEKDVKNSAEAMLTATKDHAKALSKAVTLCRSIVKAVEFGLPQHIQNDPVAKQEADRLLAELKAAGTEIDQLFPGLVPRIQPNIAMPMGGITAPGSGNPPAGPTATIGGIRVVNQPGSGTTRIINAGTAAGAAAGQSSVSIIPSISWYQSS